MADTFNPRFYELGLALAAQRERQARAEEQRRQYEERMQWEKEQAKQAATMSRLNVQMRAAELGGMPWMGGALGTYGQPLSSERFTSLSKSVVEALPGFWRPPEGEQLSPYETKIGQLADQLRLLQQQREEEKFQRQKALRGLTPEARAELEKLKAELRADLERKKHIYRTQEIRERGAYKLKGKAQGREDKIRRDWMKTVQSVLKKATNKGRVSVTDLIVAQNMGIDPKRLKGDGDPIKVLQAIKEATRRRYPDVAKAAQDAIDSLSGKRKPKKKKPATLSPSVIKALDLAGKIYKGE